ncbi:hypothetical protein RDV50_08275 [Neisseria subflava]|uniref:hypothetical protein n=1 Tax=Neisseria subflava TaxID=28449 RepID=UPI0010BE67A7|nr:hypothetical protein [Neisseria subflava]QCL71132.1 hypothetical protein FAH66_06330 [Neisseria subflava]WMS17360.1 hypothetical protein RDV50_08275 [Neisseria subflava]
MIDKSDYVEFLGCLDNIIRVSGISFRKDLDGEEINTEEALFAVLLEEAKKFDKFWREIIECKVFKHFGELPHFKIYHKKAVKFWKTEHQNKGKSLEEFIRDLANEWFAHPTDSRGRNWRYVNLLDCQWFDGMSARTVLSSILVMAQNEFEPTITTAEAKRAAKYLQKHQIELLKQRDILKRYLQQQGITGSGIGILRRLKEQYLQQEENEAEEYLIAPNLLEIVLKQQDTKNVTAKRVTGSLLKLDKHLSSRSPVSAITELANLMNDELVSDDTINRYIKSLKAIRNELNK